MSNIKSSDTKPSEIEKVGASAISFINLSNSLTPVPFEIAVIAETDTLKITLDDGKATYIFRADGEDPEETFDSISWGGTIGSLLIEAIITETDYIKGIKKYFTLVETRESVKSNATSV